MGTSGINPFDNDDALEFLEELLETPSVKTIDAQFSPLLDKEDYLEAPDCSKGLAAAEILLFLCGHQSATNQTVILASVGEVRGTITDMVLDRAVLAVDNIASRSELKELIEEDSAQASQWKRDLTKLADRLRECRRMPVEKRKKPKAKRQRQVKRRPGDFFRVPLDNGLFVYGRVIMETTCYFYDHITNDANTPLETIRQTKKLFMTGVNDIPFNSGKWPIIGNLPLEESLQPPLYFWRRASRMDGSWGYNIYVQKTDGYEDRRASEEECKGLDELVSDAEESVLERIKQILEQRKVNPRDEDEKQ